MTDEVKLSLIEKIATEAFSDKWREQPEKVVNHHRTQSLANIYALFIYDGLTVPEGAVEAVVDPVKEEDAQVTFDDLFNQGYTEEGGTHDKQ